MFTIKTHFFSPSPDPKEKGKKEMNMFQDAVLMA